MSLAMAPSPFPLVQSSALRPSIPNDINRLLSAQRLAYLGYSRQINSPPIPSTTNANTPSTQVPMQSNLTNSSANSQTSSQPALSSVARRKQRIANNSVPSYAFGITPNATQASPAPSSSTNRSQSPHSAQPMPNQPVLAPVGVVDMRFLTRQPPTVQRPLAQNQAKSASKESSVGTPTSPTAPLAAGPAPKNQRPKPTARAAPAAATNGKSTSSTATTSNGGNKSDTVDKDALKSKHAFLFRPSSQQPTSGPYVRYSPMYHYYHPYRNLHREAIKAEWTRLHPMEERIAPPEEEEVTTPPRRTSGRQKKANVRGVAARGRADKSKKGAAAVAATASQTNDAAPASPPPVNGRRSRANAAKSRSGAKTAAKGKGGRSGGGAASKRKRADLEEEDKQSGGKDDVVPTPPTKRPRRGAAAAAAAIATAALEAEEAGSNKDEASPTEAQDDGEPKATVKRRMRPNARKTAAARAAAMEAKVSHTSPQLVRNDNRDIAKQKQKKRSTEDGEVTEDGGEEEGALESLKDDENESVSKPDESQKAETPGVDLETQPGVERDDALPDGENQVEPEAEQDPEPERKTKSRKGGFGAAKGARAKTKRGGFGSQKRAPAPLTINTRGTPRGTPQQVDDEAGSLPPDQDDAQSQSAPVGRRNTRKAAPGESGLGITVNPAPAKSKRAAGGGRKSRQDTAALVEAQEQEPVPMEEELAVDPMLIAEDQVLESQQTIEAAEPDVAVLKRDLPGMPRVNGGHTLSDRVYLA